MKRYGDRNKLINKYVICYYRNGEGDIRFLADHEYEEFNWTRHMCNAKGYIDLTAARIKCENLKYTTNPINALVMRVTREFQLLPVRR